MFCCTVYYCILCFQPSVFFFCVCVCGYSTLPDQILHKGKDTEKFFRLDVDSNGKVKVGDIVCKNKEKQEKQELCTLY